MKQLQLLLIFCGIQVCAFGQFSIGRTTITFNDPSRTGGFGSGGGPGRQIQTEIYYPASSSGVNAPLLNGNYPLIVFGHGFVMTWDSYQNIIDHYVPMGYVLAFPRTEGGISPSHNEFALDLIQVATSMESQHANQSSLLYQFWNGKKAIMGHSMGGGASFLAAGNPNATFQLIVGLAPAETNPSAITASAAVAIPTVVFSGTEDAVTPPNDHHLPIYTAVTSNCKQFISITGGAHCYFANTSTTCDFGESTSGGNISITRAQQHATTFLHLDPVLAFYLQPDCSKWSPYISGLSSDMNITFQNNCTYSLPVSPTITQTGSQLSIPPTSLSVSWSLNGNPIVNATTNTIDTAGNGGGTYTVTVTDANGCSASASIQVTTLGIDVQWMREFVAYPNPTENEVIIEWNDADLLYFELLDCIGKTIATHSGVSGMKISLQALQQGYYFLRSPKGTLQRITKI